MTYQNAIAMIRELIGTHDTMGTWKEATLCQFLNMACRQVWNDIVWVSKGRFATDVYVTYPGGVPFQPIFADKPEAAARIMQIVQAYRMPHSGNQSSSNVPEPLTPCEPSRIEEYATIQAFGGRQRYYTLIGPNFCVRPIPAGTEHYLLKMILAPTELHPDDAEVELLDGLCPLAHDIICLRAAYLASLKTREVAAVFAQEAQEGWARILPFIQPAAIRPVQVEAMT